MSCPPRNSLCVIGGCLSHISLFRKERSAGREIEKWVYSASLRVRAILGNPEAILIGAERGRAAKSISNPHKSSYLHL